MGSPWQKIKLGIINHCDFAFKFSSTKNNTSDGLTLRTSRRRKPEDEELDKRRSTRNSMASGQQDSDGTGTDNKSVYTNYMSQIIYSVN